MAEKRISPRIVFLLVLLIAIGIFLLYSRLTFTGYVTSEYFSGTATLNDFSNASVFENTKFDGTSAVVLENVSLIMGNFTSPFFAAPNDTEVFWTALSQNFDVSLNPSTSSAAFYYRACNDNLNCTADFIPVTSANLLFGKYFQYKVEMRTSAASPRFYGVIVSYHTPLNLPISIDSPLNTTYNNETVLLKITANGSAIWFFNGTSNETYVGEVNRTFSEGSHIITAWVGDTHENVNSTSVTFTVGFIKTFYRLQNNVCSAVSTTTAQKTANDYDTVAACQSHVTSSNTSSTTTGQTTLTEITEECIPEWVPSEWSECVNGKQTRTCVDANECEDTTEVCPTEQDCVAAEAPVQTSTETPTTTETSKKGFLSIVGSTITAPFTYMFGNRTRIFIFSGVLLVIIAGFLVFKFSLKTRLKVLKLLNLRKRKSSNTI